MKLASPFVGRRKGVAEFHRLHAQRRHPLILEATGFGKSPLVQNLRGSLELRVGPASKRLSEICQALEIELERAGSHLRLGGRKHRLLALDRRIGQLPGPAQAHAD